MITKKHMEAFKNATPYYQRGPVTVTSDTTHTKEGTIAASKISTNAFYIEHVTRPNEYETDYWMVYCMSGIHQHLKCLNQLFKFVGADISLNERGHCVEILQEGEIVQTASPFEPIVIHEKH